MDWFSKMSRISVSISLASIIYTLCTSNSFAVDETNPRHDAVSDSFASNFESSQSALTNVEKILVKLTATPLVKALWEPSRPEEGAKWSAFAYGVVEGYAPALMAGTKDVADFCPNYSALSAEQKTSFWVYLVSAITKYESAFDPTSRMKEVGLGVDPVTKKQVYSEGLLQLSYQDALNYPFCSEFNWSKDKLLAARDPKKTILDPYKNLQCGIRILNKLAAKKRLISFSGGHYWSTLTPSGKYSQAKNIKNLTKQILFCRK